MSRCWDFDSLDDTNTHPMTSDNLRIRIATAIEAAAQPQEWRGILDCNKLADAVIAELGLTRVDDTNLTHFQYVTDWQEFGIDE